jgi:hypothetical protein
MQILQNTKLDLPAAAAAAVHVRSAHGSDDDGASVDADDGDVNSVRPADEDD